MQKGNNSMVILIGGVGYAGKTLMAQQLLEKYKYPYLSIDHLKMGLYRANIGCGFTPYDSSEVIGEKLWPILKGIIMTNIENNQNLIIEGSYLLPQRVKELDEEYLKKIISFYLGYSKSYIEKYFQSKIICHSSVIEERNYENDDTLENYLIENNSQKKLCQINNAKFFEINNNYQKGIDEVYNWFDYELSRKLQFDK